MSDEKPAKKTRYSAARVLKAKKAQGAQGAGPSAGRAPRKALDAKEPKPKKTRSDAGKTHLPRVLPKTKPDLTIELYHDRKPWEFHEWETRESYHAFCVYLHLGPSRSLAATAFELLPQEKKNRILSGKQVDVNDAVGEALGAKNGEKTTSRAITRGQAKNGTISSWCSIYMWVARSAAWDAHLAELDRAQLIDNRADLSRRTLDLGKYLQKVGKEWLEKLPALGKSPSYAEALKMMELGQKFEKGALGIDDETAAKINMSVQNNYNFENLNDKELDTLIELQSRVVTRGGKSVIQAKTPGQA